MKGEWDFSIAPRDDHHRGRKRLGPTHSLPLHPSSKWGTQSVGADPNLDARGRLLPRQWEEYCLVHATLGWQGAEAEEGVGTPQECSAEGLPREEVSVTPHSSSLVLPQYPCKAQE
jgi:hypothetical protein